MSHLNSTPFLRLSKQHNIHKCLIINNVERNTLIPSTSEYPKKNRIQPERRRELNRRPSTRQKSYVLLGSATGRALGLGSSSGDLDSDSAANIISCSPCSINQFVNSSRARSSMNSFRSLARALRIFADLPCCFRWKSCRRSLEQSKKKDAYDSGGSDSSDTATLTLRRQRV